MLDQWQQIPAGRKKAYVALLAIVVVGFVVLQLL